MSGVVRKNDLRLLELRDLTMSHVCKHVQIPSSRPGEGLRFLAFGAISSGLIFDVWKTAIQVMPAQGPLVSAKGTLSHSVRAASAHCSCISMLS